MQTPPVWVFRTHKPCAVPHGTLAYTHYMQMSIARYDTSTSKRAQLVQAQETHNMWNEWRISAAFHSRQQWPKYTHILDRYFNIELISIELCMQSRLCDCQIEILLLSRHAWLTRQTCCWLWWWWWWCWACTTSIHSTHSTQTHTITSYHIVFYRILISMFHIFFIFPFAVFWFVSHHRELDGWRMSLFASSLIVSTSP